MAMMQNRYQRVVVASHPSLHQRTRRSRPCRCSASLASSHSKQVGGTFDTIGNTMPSLADSLHGRRVGQYLAVITERQMMGTIQGHNVYRVAKVSIIAYHLNPNAALNEQQRKDEATYLRVVDSLLNDRVSTQRHCFESRS